MKEFYQDVKEKKSLVPSARRRRGGSKSKYVSLPHDNMTPAQWKKRNGVISVYDLKSPMNWEQFKALPDDLKGDYIRFLQGEFNASGSAIAKCLGITQPYLKSYLDNLGVNVTFQKKARKKEDVDRLFGFFGLYVEGSVQEPEVVDAPQAEEVVVEVVNQPAIKPEPVEKMQLPSFTLNFAGPFDIDVLTQSLKFMIGAGTHCNICINVTKE